MKEADANIWHEQGDGISYRYAKGRYNKLAQRDSEGETAQCCRVIKSTKVALQAGLHHIDIIQ